MNKRADAPLYRMRHGAIAELSIGCLCGQKNDTASFEEQRSHLLEASAP